MIIRKKKKRRARRRRSFNWRIPLFAGLGLIVIAAAVFAFVYFNGSEANAESGVMQFRLNNKSAVIIRSESVYTSSERMRLDYLCEDGQTVEAGAPLARVYKLGYSEELTQQLLNAREAVYEAQMERIGATKDSKLEEMNEAIAGFKEKIRDRVMLSSGEDLEALYRQLDDLLKERMEYLRSKVQETENLRALYAAADEKEQLISTWTEDITSEDEGVVSYYFDGYEQALTASKLNMISADLIKRALKETGASKWNNDDKTRVCRIVDTDKWYAAFVTDYKDTTRVAEGVEYEVEFRGYGKHTGVALEPVISGTSIVNIIEFNDELGGLIEARTVKVNVKATVSGVTVKSKAIRFDEGKAYIQLVTGGIRNSMRVDVLASDGEIAVVRPYESSDVLIEGVRYWYTIRKQK